MTEENNKLSALFSACWKDEALKARFMANPAEVLGEFGMEVPAGLDVKVVENGDNCVHITLPVPPTGHQDLSDDEMASAAGGGCNWNQPTQCLIVYNTTANCPIEARPV